MNVRIWAPLVALGLACVAAAADPMPPVHDAMKLVFDQEKAWNRGDLAGFMAGYWKSPELTFVSGGKVTRGWDATMERYQKRYQAEGKEMGKLAFSDTTGRQVSDAFYIITGRWELTLSKSPDKPGGRFTLFIEKKPEGWRVTYDHTSADDK
ncbi:MAG: DUF4440 domain-containing protein [Gemmataceae bacterium]